jgi:hypothetical protein
LAGESTPSLSGIKHEVVGGDKPGHDVERYVQIHYG